MAAEGGGKAPDCGRAAGGAPVEAAGAFGLAPPLAIPAVDEGNAPDARTGAAPAGAAAPLRTGVIAGNAPDVRTAAGTPFPGGGAEGSGAFLAAAVGAGKEPDCRAAMGTPFVAPAEPGAPFIWGAGAACAGAAARAGSAAAGIPGIVSGLEPAATKLVAEIAVAGA